MKGQINGYILGVRSQTVKGQDKYLYQVLLCPDDKDANGLFTSDCSVVTLWEDSPLVDSFKLAQPVLLDFELVQYNNGSARCRYSNLRPVPKK